MSSLAIGASALTVDQQALNLIGQNVANANTTGYHRQVTDLAALTNGTPIGSGVQITQIERLINNGLESAIYQNNFQTGTVTSQLNSVNQVQSILGTGTGSVADLLNQFFSQLQQLSTQPDNTTQRQVVLSTAGNLASQLNATAGSFDQVQANLDTQAQNAVTNINTLAAQVAQVNGAIQQATLQGTDVNDLEDQRDQLISQLSQLTDVRTLPGDSNQVNVLAAGEPLVEGTTSVQLQYEDGDGTQGQVTIAGSGTPLSISGGTLGGLLQTRNTVLPQFTSQLDALTQALVQNVDEVQATGLGLNGPMTSLTGDRAVSSATAPLSQAGLAFPPQAGSLYITVTNQATGQQTLSQINIDPATDSLQTVASAINGVGNVQAVVNSQTNTLSILAAPGYAFDFAGQVPSSPQTSNITGTATPQTGGAYTGTTNDTYTFQVAGSGTVGVTPGLTLNAYDSSGTLLGSQNIGQGYTAGTALSAVNGVTASLGAGTVNNGDSFSTAVVANPDTAGILSALGLNTFFTGTSAADVQVNPALANDANQLAASRTGDPGDNANVQRLLALGNQPVLGNGTLTLSQAYASMATAAGSQVQDLTQQQTALQALGQQLSTQQQAVSGVDPNEELVNMLQYQQAFQMSAQYVNVVNEAMTYLFQVIA